MNYLCASFVRNRGKWAHKQFELQIIRQHGNYHLCPNVQIYIRPFITHAPWFRGGEDYICESLLSDSSLVMNIRNPFMHWIYIYWDICVDELDQHWYSRQAITWTNVRLLPIGPLETNFSEIPIKLQNFYLKKMHSKKNVCEMATILSKGRWVNTLRPRQNGRNLPDDIFKCISLNENVWISIEISLKFVRKG